MGKVNHDWTLTVPFVGTRFGIVEWQNGTSTVFLGIVDFPLRCGARSAALIIGVWCFAVFLALTAYVLLRRSRRWQS